MKGKTSLLKKLKEIDVIVSSGYEEIAKHLPKGSIPIGFFCPFVPEELLHAAGTLPFRLISIPMNMSHTQAYLPPYCCHLIKSSLENLLLGKLNFLKGVIFSHTCDSMQGLSDIWAHQRRIPLHFDLMIPSHLNSESSKPYFRAEIERFKEFLESHFGKITHQKLKTSIQLFNHIRELIGKIYALRRKGPGLLSGNDFANVIRAGFWMDRSHYLNLLKELVDTLPKNRKDDQEFIPIYLSGNMAHSAPYFSLIEEAGGHVVQDDLCSGSRTLRLMVPENPDPVEALVQRYFESFFCPTKYINPEAHMETLWKDVQESGARGVIFLLYKYCEAHYFDYPDLKSMLESKGIPTLLLEIEDPSTAKEQLKVRVQAFIEMLSPF
jgi:benzoyl-CoA reductase/2-hydroxyglutaryl-CoA dehydratase subunit BcrC/BadD/HgdB